MHKKWEVTKVRKKQGNGQKLGSPYYIFSSSSFYFVYQRLSLNLVDDWGCHHVHHHVKTLSSSDEKKS